MLVISSVDYSHVGEYTCRATNPAGSVTHSANLRVNGKHRSAQEGTEICLGVFSFFFSDFMF